MKVRYNWLHKFTYWIAFILFVPVMTFIGGVFQLNYWLIIGGLSSGYFILFLMKTMVYSIDDKFKMFNVQEGFHQLEYSQINRFELGLSYVDFEIDFYYEQNNKPKKAYYIFKTKYELCDGLNILIKHFPIEMIDLKLLEQSEI